MGIDRLPPNRLVGLMRLQCALCRDRAIVRTEQSKEDASNQSFRLAYTSLYVESRWVESGGRTTASCRYPSELMRFWSVSHMQEEHTMKNRSITILPGELVWVLTTPFLTVFRSVLIFHGFPPFSGESEPSAWPSAWPFAWPHDDPRFAAREPMALHCPQSDLIYKAISAVINRFERTLCSNCSRWPGSFNSRSGDQLRSNLNLIRIFKLGWFKLQVHLPLLKVNYFSNCFTECFFF